MFYDKSDKQGTRYGKGDEDKMEKDKDSEEESSDYSCSPVTKNELLTAAKYRTIKFAIVLAPAISISLFHFICSKPLSRLLRVLHQHRVTGNQEWKKISPHPRFTSIFLSGSLNFFKILDFPLSFPRLLHSLHLIFSSVFLISLLFSKIVCFFKLHY